MAGTIDGPQVSGKTDPAFARVREVFEAHFQPDATLQEVGAAVAVCAGRRCVVDLWGGVRSTETKEAWTPDTLVNVWSTTKGVMAIAVAQLVAAGKLDYAAPVARYWPEFAAAGKDGVTVEQVMSHQAGLNGFAEPTTVEDFGDWETVTARLAVQAPLWPPGEKNSYHAMTYGFLAGEIARRASGLMPRELIAQTVAGPINADFQIGVAEADWTRTAPLIPPPRSPADAPTLEFDPLAAACAQGGYSVIGFDVDKTKIEQLDHGRSYIDGVTSDDLGSYIARNVFRATSDFSDLSICDAIVICVPTPLTRHREPNLKYVTATVKTIATYLHPGQLIVLESTTYPGTTEEVVKPILESGGLRSGVDFFLGFSPEREDPGNARFRTTTIPKIVSGDGSIASDLIQEFYKGAVEKVVAVSSPSTAEAVKITENVFRAVNIALVNELKVVYAAMGIDIWEVINAATTKPFGYMPFYPGPGLGGHCIPVDPFYLTWKAREYGLTTRFIELAGEINVAMPKYVVGRLEEELDRQQKVSLSAAKILLLGLAYKKNVSDVRESPSLELMEILRARGASIDFHDPHATIVPQTREYAQFTGLKSAELNAAIIGNYNGVVVATDHDAVDYQQIARYARLIIDTRNVYGRLSIKDRKIQNA